MPMSSSMCQVELEQPQQGFGSKLASQRSHSTKPFKWAHTIPNTVSDSDSETDQLEKKHSYQNSNITTKDNGDKLGGWSFIQALAKEEENYKEHKEKLYVHPNLLLKLSSSPRLSEKSLELCTENLGCETGNGGTSSLSSSDSESGDNTYKFLARERSNLRKKAANSRSFPPPLTSISNNADNVHFRRHREGGRLVIKAVAIAPSSQACFKAERADGHLRLRYVNSNSYSTEYEEEKDDDDDDDDDDEVVAENGDNGQVEEEMDGNSGNDGGEMGIEKYQRPCRCKEGGSGNKRLLNFESFWVAT